MRLAYDELIPKRLGVNDEWTERFEELEFASDIACSPPNVSPWRLRAARLLLCSDASSGSCDDDDADEPDEDEDAWVELDMGRDLGRGGLSCSA
jgi:hypothetical protein